MNWILAALAFQAIALILLARKPLWRALGVSGLIAVGVIGWLCSATGGGRSNPEAWLVLTALPLVTLGVVAWHEALGKLALGFGVGLTLALLAAWRWATVNPAVDATDAVIVYASLVLVAMVALFMIAGVLGMRLLVAHGRRLDAGNG